MENGKSAKFKINLYGFLLFSILLFITAGAGIQALFDFWDNRKYDPPGELIRMDGYRLHLYCIGSGEFTVLLESDLTFPSIEWRMVQEKFTDRVQVCSYDRAGLGWSESSTVPREGQEMVEELYRLLRKANINNQLILAGDGSGTLLARLFAHRYPESVSGLILVDPYREEYASVFKSGITNLSLNTQLYRISTITTWLGITRLSGSLGWLNHLKEPIADLPLSFQREFLFLTAYKTKYWSSAADDLLALDNLLDEVSKNNDLGDVPLIILANQSTLEDAGLNLDDASNPGKVDLVNKLKDISTRSSLELCTDCGIIPPMSNPDAVVNTIENMVEQINP